MGDVVTAAHAARAALAAYEGGPAVAEVVLLDGRGAGRRLLVFEAGEVRGSLGAAELDTRAAALGRDALAGGGGRVEPAGDEGARLYVQLHRAPEELVIVGAGHIAVPLARLGVLLAYRVTVLDDREDFAAPARFPGAAEVRRVDFSDPFRDVRLGPRSHVLLVTRAHRYDFDCLRRLLSGDELPRYIGMLGSRRRVRAAFRALLGAGIPRERLARVSAPVGLDIGGETPEEIAISIAAELVAVRRGRGAAAPGPTAGPVAGGSGNGSGAGVADASGLGRTADPDATIPRDAEPGSSSDPFRNRPRHVPTRAAKERVLDRLLPEDAHG